MKCLSMKIADILLLLANFITIYSSDLRQDKTSQTTETKDEEIYVSKFKKDCPQLLEIILKNNLKDYTINCKKLTVKVNSDIPTEEDVLQSACFLVKKLLSHNCHYFNFTNISLKQDNVDFCPFNFSHLEKMGININPKDFINELTIKDHCLMVCKDLYGPKVQCDVLNIFNNFLYLNSINQPLTQKDQVSPVVEKVQVKPEQAELTLPKTENVAVSTKSGQQPVKSDKIVKTETETTVHKSSEAKLNATKAMKAENKTEKSETVSLTSNKQETTESELPVIENSVPENIEEQFNNEEDLGEADYQVGGPRPDLASDTNIPKAESFEKKLAPKSQKDTYPSADGFFQAEDSHFFFYFIMVSSVIVIGYLAFHNKNKILAYALEGTNGRRSRRRPNPARYRKLETNLEEVISSNSTNVAASSVVY